MSRLLPKQDILNVTGWMYNNIEIGLF